MTLMSLAAVDEAFRFSEETLSAVRRLLADRALPSHVCVVATGSFGRREASGESDVDFFVVHGDELSESAASQLVAELASAIKTVIPRPPSPDGAFSTAQPITQMLANIGGENDRNRN